ncbi:MAG: TIGR04076 family protein [Ruminococcaceae bacterium]|nr:TIGR04076 family protein [Oscillospiraceae bacterium]
MKKVRITALRQTCHEDLMAKYENPIEHTCDVRIGQTWLSVDGQKPENFCDSAWESMCFFVEELAAGGGNFYDGWMKNPYSAMISCNDGFRPVSFYLEAMEND